MHSGCDAGIAVEEGDRKIAEGFLLHFRTTCEGEAAGEGLGAGCMALVRCRT